MVECLCWMSRRRLLLQTYKVEGKYWGEVSSVLREGGCCFTGSKGLLGVTIGGTGTRARGLGERASAWGKRLGQRGLSGSAIPASQSHVRGLCLVETNLLRRCMYCHLTLHFEIRRFTASAELCQSVLDALRTRYSSPNHNRKETSTASVIPEPQSIPSLKHH